MSGQVVANFLQYMSDDFFFTIITNKSSSVYSSDNQNSFCIFSGGNAISAEYCALRIFYSNEIWAMRSIRMWYRRCFGNVEIL